MIKKLFKKTNFKSIINYIPFVFLLFTMFLYMILIPPFQNPDEIQHFGQIVTMVYPETEYEMIEKKIINILWDYKWFVFVGMGQPEIPPEKLRDIKYLGGYKVSKIKENITLFHIFYGFLLSLFKKSSLLFLFYLARFISFLFTFVTIIMIFGFLRSKSKKDLNLLVLLFFMIPQFLIIGTSVNYEVFSIFFGALFFISMFKLHEKFSYTWLFLLNIGILGSLFSKKGGWLFFVFLALSFIITIFDLKKIFYSVFVLSIVFILFSWINYLLPEKMSGLYRNLFRGIGMFFKIVPDKEILTSFPDFALLIFKSFYAKIGWMAFEIGDLWYIGFLSLILISIFGLLFFSKNKNNYTILIFTIFIITIQIVASWEWYGKNGVFAQGRYFFPLIMPFFYIMFLGLKEVDRKIFKNKNIILKLFICFNISANFYIIIFKIIPIFYLTFLSPHKGI